MSDAPQSDLPTSPPPGLAPTPPAQPAVNPTTKFLITEARKLLAPALTALITALAAGLLGFWRGDAGKKEAVNTAVSTATEQQQALRIAFRAAIADRIRGSAGWSEVGSRVGEVDTTALIAAVLSSQHAQSQTQAQDQDQDQGQDQVQVQVQDPDVIRALAQDEIRSVQSQVQAQAQDR